MKRSTQKILTTHNGSLPRPRELLQMLVAREKGDPPDRATFSTAVRRAVGEVVKKQEEAGITVINDGEVGKPSYATYIKDRLTGFEGEESATTGNPEPDFPEWAARSRTTNI